MKNIFRNFTKFELGLWLTSVVLVSASYLLVPEKDVLTLLASVIGVTALIFVAKGYVLGQILCVIFAVFYGVISFFFRYYGEMITYLCMSAPMAISATVSWLKHPYGKTKEVEVHRLNGKHIAVVCALTVAVTVAFYFILKALNTPNLLFSTLSVATSFLASALTFLRSPYYALAYGANDVVLIVLWVLATVENVAYFPMIICFSVFLANDLYGFFNWQRIQKRQGN